MVNGRLNVLQSAWCGQSLNGSFKAHAKAHVGLCIAQLHIGLNAVKHGGCNGQITFTGICVDHFANVRIDAKNFLNDHHRGFGGGSGLRHISGNLGAVGRCECDERAHEILLKN